MDKNPPPIRVSPLERWLLGAEVRTATQQSSVLLFYTILVKSSIDDKGARWGDCIQRIAKLAVGGLRQLETI